VPVFVDTNVLIYALDEADPQKHTIARAWRAELWKSRAGRISYQVLQEFYANVRQKWPSATEGARAEIRDLLTWRPVSISAELLELGWKIQDRCQLSFWDAMIVAAAKACSCQYLLTEDLQAGQDLEGVIVVNPFHNQPEPFVGDSDSGSSH
jgi:predicted nucleic acid-binding protein